MAIPTDPQTLLTNAACFECIPPGMRLSVLNYLLCQIANNGGGGGGGASAFIQLSDVPQSYAGAGSDQVQVNSGATGLTFVAPIFVLQSGGGYVGALQSGNARGSGAIDIQSGRSQITHVASAAKAMAFGYDNTANVGGAMAFGYQNTVNGSLAMGFGKSNTVSGSGAGAFGTSNSITATPSTTVIGTSNTVQNPTGINFVAGNSNTINAPAGSVGKITIVGWNNSVLDGQLYVFGGTNSITANGNGSVLVGTGNTCDHQFNFAFGGNNTCNSQNNNYCFGFGNTSSGGGSAAFGVRAVATNTHAIVFGYNSTCSGINSGAFGYGCTAGTAQGSFAFGYNAVCRLAGSCNIGGAIFNRKDNAESVANAYQVWAGVDVMLLSQNISLTATSTQTINIPTGAHFYPSEVGLICSAINTGTVQPTVSFGFTGSNAAILAATLCTTLNAARARQVFGTLLTNAGQTSLTGTITVAATATSQTGRFYFRGMLIEDN